MPYYLYIPIAQKNIPANLRSTIKQWVDIEKKRNKDVIVTYLGDKGLINLPQHAKIYVLAPGQAIETPQFLRKVPTKLALGFESTARQFYLSLNPAQQIFVPDIVTNMVADGLFAKNDEHGQQSKTGYNLRIKLFFFDAKKQAQRLAEVFYELLSEQAPRDEEMRALNNIRLDYYPNYTIQGPRKINEQPDHKYTQTTPTKRTKDIRDSIYNNEVCKPVLTLEQVKLAIDEYNRYKSSRCCGLSGLLGLNGLFSSDESTYAIRALNGASCDTTRFEIAQRYMRKYPENKFAECLHPFIDRAREANNSQYWHMPSNQI